MAEIVPFVFSLSGGLVLNKSSFEINPGAAVELQNYEPSIRGGYRRINGYTKWNSTVVPYTGSANEKVLMSAIFGTTVIAARGEKVFTGGTSGAWTQIDTGRTNAKRYTFERFNFNGTDKIIFADGANHASTWDGTNLVDMNGASGTGAGTAPSAPQLITIFKDHIFYADSTTNTVTFSAPFSENDFTSGNGAGTIKIDSTIVGMKVFREELYIFGATRIFKLTGSSSSNFAMQPVARSIGCVSGFTIQEFAGDLVYLGPDGLRTIAGTSRIGDVELGTISQAVRPLFAEQPDPELFESLVIPSKTQYRIFFCNDGRLDRETKGIVCVLKGEGYEFSELRGIKPASTDTERLSGVETVIHGGYDGYIYQQEKGNSFDGAEIEGTFRSPDLTMGDAGVSKSFTHLLINYSPESAVNATIALKYDYSVDTAVNPAPYPLSVSSLVSVYGTQVYGAGIYGGASDPVLRQPIEGSGYAIAIRIVDDGTTSSPYTMRGFQLEFSQGTRR